MSLHRFADSQVVPIGRDEAWAFFSDPRNLGRITPPGMGFRLLEAPPEQIYPGLILRYRVRPLAGVPVTWVTEITHVRTGDYFVDEQRMGPYRLWHHQHHFVEVPGGIELRDVVHYALPFGPLGALLNRVVVGPRVRDIFAYRRAVLARMFGARAPAAEHESAPIPALPTAGEL